MPDSSKRDSRLNFFFDNCFPKKLTAALIELCPDHHLEHLTTRFRPDAPDAEWVQQLADEGGWIMISGDYDLISVPHVTRLIRENNLVAVVLKKGFTNLGLWDFASKISKAWPSIVDATSRSKPGSIWTLAVRSLKLEEYRPPKF